MSRLMFHSAVFLVLEQGEQWFTLRRANTGFTDGKLNLPSGHLEEGETPLMAMVREAKEEAGVTVRAEDLELCHSQFYFGHRVNDRNYCNYFFRARAYEGEPYNAEPEKASEGKWSTLDDPDLTRFLQLAWTCTKQGIMYSEHILNKGEQP